MINLEKTPIPYTHDIPNIITQKRKLFLKGCLLTIISILKSFEIELLFIYHRLSSLVILENLDVSRNDLTSSDMLEVICELSNLKVLKMRECGLDNLDDRLVA